MSTPRKVTNRPKKRTLVRWDENLNELLLLTVQSVCNTKSIKIPWADVANTMGHNVTEGAIVQHLAKLRSRRVSADKAVPPPLRRGATATSKTSEGTPAKSVEDDEPKQKSSRSRNTISGSRSRPQRQDVSSDEDWIQGRSSRSRRLQKRRKSATKVVESSSESEQSESDEEDNRSVASSNDLLVPGAKFLEYPNDVGPAQHKVVTLKYRRPSAEKAGDAPSKSQESVKDTEVKASVAEPSKPSSAFSFNSNTDLMGLLSPDLAISQAVETFMQMPELPSDDHIGSDGLWSSGLGPPFPSSLVYPAFNSGFNAIAANDPLAYSHDVMNSLVTYDPVSYPHMPMSYTRADEPMNDFDVTEDMK
ncbi:hypothetical protein ASPBRDRAFT_130200 [Aspergillus brasiliensis CBS 101740]|uniref:Myb-like domain-containing protein n=1 Tax=Aspergillus brasiliensis (strain CBS 101740 / IMI 381727 / IBT 21946) TaxID=767769 RepID=A0A1L9UEY6_ASPBC|nr:hypothetical protein ASPBRDRAFT_130200 [Aspergillus brasiliensis CBS 101740]